MTFRFTLGLAALAVLVGACHDDSTPSAGDDDDDDDSNPSSSSGAATSSSGSESTSSSGGSSGAGPGSPHDVGGTAYAPNGELALPGVLVYWTHDAPAPLPTGVSCAICPSLPDGTSTISAADGSFSLAVPTDESFYLVVQRGRFRRVRQMSVPQAIDHVDADVTSLPAKTDADLGDTIPAIVLLSEPQDSFVDDAVQVALDHAGIEEWTHFESDATRLETELGDYQLALFPSNRDDTGPSQAQIDAIRSFVASGGIVYATDSSHEFVDAALPEFFSAEVTEHDLLTPNGDYVDLALTDFLEAQGDAIHDVPLQEAWSSFQGIQAAQVPGPAGEPNVTSTPRVWATVDEDAATGTGQGAVSFAFGCGQALLSSFHAHDTYGPDDLAAQDKAMFFALLDLQDPCDP